MGDRSAPTVALIVVAAGRGARLGADAPKQYLPCGSRSLLATTLGALHQARPEASLQVVIHADDDVPYRRAVAEVAVSARERLRPPVIGGPTRQLSVGNGLEAFVPSPPDLVLIHDAARPFASAALVARAVEAAERHGAAAPGVPLSDTIVEIDAQGGLVATPPRAALRATQTPQAFRFPLILAAHRSARALGVEDLTDDAAVARLAGHDVRLFEGDRDNFKVTTMEDLRRAEARILAPLNDLRVGHGFDVHAFAEGDGVWLGGVRVPHDKTLFGHSDADVALHALCDAIYGALGDGDIGRHFPPSEARWRGTPSSVFLEHAAARVRARGGAIAHLDLTLVCEAPKIGPHREAMRERIAEIAGLAIDRIGVKATTSEGLGFTGRGEGIAAYAVATIRLPAATA